MTAISSADWSTFRQHINAASASMFNQLVIWKHLTKKLDIDGDDRAGQESYTDTNLYGILSYNAWNVLPVSRLNVDGVIDRNGAVLIFNKDYLRGLGLINAAGNFHFDSVKDRFSINGIIFKPMGDTPVAQAYDDPLFQYIILSRDEVKTGY